MFFTLLMSKLFTSMEVSAVHPQNMPAIDVTSEVFRFSIPTMLVNWEKLKNHMLRLVGRTILKLFSNLTEVTFSFTPVSFTHSGLEVMWMISSSYHALVTVCPL